MKRVVLAVLVMASAAALVMVGCQSRAAEERAVADRLDAEAGLALAEADAYQRRVEANTSAEAVRSSMRQFERDASHERTLEVLPFALLTAGITFVGILIAIALFGWLRCYQGPQADPAMFVLLHQQDRRLLDLERATYHVISRQQRRLTTVNGIVHVKEGSEQ